MAMAAPGNTTKNQGGFRKVLVSPSMEPQVGVGRRDAKPKEAERRLDHDRNAQVHGYQDDKGRDALGPDMNGHDPELGCPHGPGCVDVAHRR